MKYLLLTILGLAIFFSSCEKEEDTACYIFTTTVYQDIIGFPDNPDFPKTTENEMEECDITEDEAKQITSEFVISNVDTIGGFIFISESTCTYRRK
jgi:hypothetical protein